MKTYDLSLICLVVDSKTAVFEGLPRRVAEGHFFLQLLCQTILVRALSRAAPRRHLGALPTSRAARCAADTRSPLGKTRARPVSGFALEV